jgi:hypothetical protein
MNHRLLVLLLVATFVTASGALAQPAATAPQTAPASPSSMGPDGDHDGDGIPNRIDPDFLARYGKPWEKSNFGSTSGQGRGFGDGTRPRPKDGTGFGATQNPRRGGGQGQGQGQGQGWRFRQGGPGGSNAQGNQAGQGRGPGRGQGQGQRWRLRDGSCGAGAARGSATP